MSELTKAEIRALVHVAAGKVTQVFTATGNHFAGPRETASRTWRKLADAGLIEDANGQQQLTAKGKAALDEAQP